MHQIKRNAALTFKTFLYQVVMSLFGFMMYSGTSKIPFLMVIGQAVIVLFFYYIMSSQMFQGGGKACEFDRSHQLSSSPLLGFLFGIIAFLPAILLSLWTVLAPPFLADGSAHTTYAPFLINKTFLQGMYVGIVQSIYPTTSIGQSATVAIQNGAALNSQCLLYLLAAIPGFLSCGVSYLLGYLHFKKERVKK